MKLLLTLVICMGLTACGSGNVQPQPQPSVPRACPQDKQPTTPQDGAPPQLPCRYPDNSMCAC